MAQREEKVVKEEDDVDDIMLVDENGDSATFLARDAIARGQTARGPGRIDSLERELTRVVRAHGKWIDTQVETADRAKKRLAEQVSELKATVASKEAALHVARSDLEKSQRDLQLARSTSINEKLQAEVTRLRGELHHERLQRREEVREAREAREEATRILGGVGSIVGPSRDPRLNRGTCHTKPKIPWINKAIGDRGRGGPSNRRGAPRGRVEKR